MGCQLDNIRRDFSPVRCPCHVVDTMFLMGTKPNTQHPISGDMQVRQEFICSQAKQVQSFPADTNFRHQCEGIIEVFHTQWAKEIMIERKRVSCGGIQKSIGLPIPLRPHQVTRIFRAIQSISICKSTATKRWLWAIWPEWAHPMCVVTMRKRHSWSVISLARAVLYFQGRHRSTTMRCKRRTL